MVTEEDIQLLDDLQQDVGGIQCVQYILDYLRRDQFEAALEVRRVEGDKTRGYPDVEEQLYKMFGCRLHGTHGCTGWLCKGKNE